MPQKEYIYSKYKYFWKEKHTFYHKIIQNDPHTKLDNGCKHYSFHKSYFISPLSYLDFSSFFKPKQKYKKTMR